MVSRSRVGVLGMTGLPPGGEFSLPSPGTKIPGRPPNPCLEFNPQRELDLPGRSLHGTDCASYRRLRKGSCVTGITNECRGARFAEVRMVQDVEEFRPEL